MTGWQRNGIQEEEKKKVLIFPFHIIFPEICKKKKKGKPEKERERETLYTKTIDSSKHLGQEVTEKWKKKKKRFVSIA